MSKAKTIYINSFFVDGKLLKQWVGKRIPKWMKNMQHLCGVSIKTEIQTME